jgi:predicted aldo/keto reductase-like oxidoreductase
MNYRRLGRTNLQVSVVGFGTAQLRLVPERQAIETLLRGFELGVNLVHTAPDYEGADDLIARALKETSREVIVCSQGYGPTDQFERFFEDTCAKLSKERLELFGIACIEEREWLGENVWGTGGMVEFLLRKKEEGRLGGLFCTTHRPPEGIRKLIEAGVFDALMIAYNVLGFHLMSECSPPLGDDPAADPCDLTSLRRRREEGFADLPRNKAEVFPVARQHDVGLMIMKPLAGGLLCDAKAFPLRAPLHPQIARVTAAEALRLILRSREVACVVPGTASPAEAEENALAGHGNLLVTPEDAHQLESNVRRLDAVLCSRCGQCTTACSQALSIPWLFRGGYASIYPTEMSLWTPEPLGYFHLHPGREATCGTCPDVTCSCPSGVDIPANLIQIHQTMVGLREKKQIPSPLAVANGVPPGVPVLPPPPTKAVRRLYRALKARVPVVGLVGAAVRRLSRVVKVRRPSENGLQANILIQDLPTLLAPGATAVCRLYLENTGRQTWYMGEASEAPRPVLRVYLGGRLQHEVRPRLAVAPHGRGHFVFELKAPHQRGAHRLELDLVVDGAPPSLGATPPVLRTELVVQDRL